MKLPRYLFLCLVQTSWATVVKTNYGDVEGEVITSKSGKRFSQFLGIPYAEPPIGELRFQKPEPLQLWDDVLETKKFAPSCHLTAFNVSIPLPQSEDCLYLNVFAPHDLDKHVKSYPVLVYIHGGGYQVGNTMIYSPEGIRSNVVERGVIVVNIQYRLGIFGFLSTGDGTVPSNVGIWDQIAALKWVHENIEAFGGDNTKITIDGESAGASSVSILSYAPPAQGYFQQVIMQSGSIFANWAVTDNSVKNARIIGKQLGCPGTSSQALVECFRQSTPDQLLAAQQGYQRLQTLTLCNDGPHSDLTESLLWTPVVDGEIIVAKPKEMKPTFRPKPAIIGVGSDEAILIAAQFPGVAGIYAPVECLYHHTETTMKHWEKLVTESFPRNETASAAVDASYAYIKSLDEGGKKGGPFFKAVMEFISDMSFVYPALYEAVYRSSAGGEVMFYRFDYFNPNFNKDSPHLQGALHALDVIYWLPQSYAQLFSFDWNSDDHKVSDKIGKLFTNFIKFGDPTKGEKLAWPKFLAHKPQIMLMKPELQVEEKLFPDRMEFWWKATRDGQKLQKQFSEKTEL